MKSYLIFLVVILLGCPEKKNVGREFLKIDINLKNKIDFNQQISDIQLIPLELNDKSRFMDCTKIRMYKDRIYLYSLSDFSVFIYSLEGAFINVLHGASRPKLENPSTVFICKTDDQLWVINERNQVMKYDPDGNFIEKETLPFRAVDMTALDNKVLLYFHGGFDKDIDYHFTSQEIKNKDNFHHMLPYQSEKEKRTYIPVSLFAETTQNDKVYILISDQIYMADKSTNYQVMPLFKLKFKDAPLLVEEFNVRELSFQENAEKRQSKKYINGIDKFYLTHDYLFMHPDGKYNTYCAINLKTHETFSFDYIFDKLDLTLSPYSILGGEENQLYCIFPNKVLINYYNTHSTLYKGIEKTLPSLPDDPNGWTIAIIHLNNK